MTRTDLHWDPASPAAQQDQIAAYDAQRRRCPLAHSEPLGWSLLGHAEVMRALLDHATFSNAVSAHPAVPNGMDPPEHTRFRAVVDRYFGAEAMAAFEPTCRRIADTLAGRLADGEVELMAGLADDFALEAQCAFMGWPESLHEPLRQWTRRNAEATRSRHPEATAGVAQLFAGYVGAELDARRAAGRAAPDDPTTRLLAERVDGRPLGDAEIVSIVRNWTVGELGTIAASIGIVAHYLAAHPPLQEALRADPSGLPAAIDEILRIQAPLIANRRVTTRPVEVAGQRLGAGERVTLIWASANRDEAVFGDPDAFDPERNAAQNLLYGAGIHVCPGAPLARLELRLVVEALLRHTRAIRSSDRAPVLATYPRSGFASLPLRIETAGDRG
jgi:cytochrome P450